MMYVRGANWLTMEWMHRKNDERRCVSPMDANYVNYWKVCAILGERCMVLTCELYYTPEELLPEQVQKISRFCGYLRDK